MVKIIKCKCICGKYFVKFKNKLTHRTSLTGIRRSDCVTCSKECSKNLKKMKNEDRKMLTFLRSLGLE